MRKTKILILILIIIVLLLVFYILPKHCAKSKPVTKPNPIPSSPNSTPSTPNSASSVEYEKNWNNLTAGEKVQYVADTYFNLTPKSEEDEKVAAEDAWIATLPKDDTTCQDGFDQCPIWADNDECTINPEFMLYNCAKSCKACALNADQKNKLDKIYNTRDPIHCVYHGEDYPGEFQYLNRLYDYTVSINY